MALNNMQLTSSLLIKMYRNSLVEIAGSSNAQETTPADSQLSQNKNASAAEWKYLGEFRKNILFVARYELVTHLPDEQLNFLVSILGACKLRMADVAILNVANAPLNVYKAVQEKFQSRFTILFGITPQQFEMPLDFPEFQVQPFNNCTFLHTPALEKLETDKILKSKLWVCLRKMFNLS